jgi:hypothetical protein
MASVQPEGRLVGGVEIGQTIDDVAQFRDDRLGPEIGRRLAARPARDGSGGHADDVGDVLALKASVVLQMVEDSADRRAHRRRELPRKFSMSNMLNSIRNRPSTIAEIAEYLTTPSEAETYLPHGPSILPEGEKGTR